MKAILKKIQVLLDKKQKKFMVLLVFMMLIGAILEVASIGIIVPVITVVMEENAITDNGMVRTLYELLHMQSKQQFVIVIMLLLVALFVVKNIYIYIQQKVMLKFVYGNQFRTSERMMKNYLRKGYEFYLNADTAMIQRNITSDVNNMYALILAVLQLVSEGIVFVCLLCVLMVSDFVMTVFIGIVLLVLLLVIKLWLKPILWSFVQSLTKMNSTPSVMV